MELLAIEISYDLYVLNLFKYPLLFLFLGIVAIVLGIIGFVFTYRKARRVNHRLVFYFVWVALMCVFPLFGSIRAQRFSILDDREMSPEIIIGVIEEIENAPGYIIMIRLMV
jgi:D-alanyl-lipoteichoic acid acyltransferase DltB (MBOAT superfamily)